MSKEIKLIQSNNDDLHLWLRACLDCKTYPWTDGKKQTAILATIEFKQFKTSNSLEVLKDINESLSDCLRDCIYCKEYHWDGHQQQAAKWAIHKLKANLTVEQENLMFDWYNIAKTNDYENIFLIYDNLDCGVFLKNGANIDCLATAMDDLGNWSILTKDLRSIQYLATEIL
jgi:hypothetical protein